MKVSRRLLFVFVAATLGGGCASSYVKPVTVKDIPLLCMQNNDGADIRIRYELMSLIHSKGIKMLAYDGASPPEGCRYVMQYAGTIAWHYGPYLNSANIIVYDGEEIIGRASYYASHMTGPQKYGSEQKLARLVNELFPEAH